MKSLTVVLKKRLNKIVKRRQASFYDKFVYKLYRHYTKKAPDEELIDAVKAVLYPEKHNVALLKDITAVLNRLTDLEQENVRLLKYSMLSPELKAAYNGGKIENIDETLKYQSYQDRYKISLHKLRLKHEAGKKIRVGFLVVWDSVFQMKSLYLKMLEDDFFEPKIVVIPHTRFGCDLVKKSYASLKKEHGNNVICGFNKETNDYINIDDCFDLITTMNPYEWFAHSLSSTQHFADLGIPTFFTNYSVPPTEGQYNLRIYPQKNLTWKIFPTDKYEYEAMKKNYLAGNNVVFFGYLKMDPLFNVEKKSRERKRIIIAPHHTVSNTGDTPVTSNFEKYAEFFLTLPVKYPQIDWVFRPHPVMWDTLKNNPDWGEEKCREYIAKITTFSNVEYQDGGDYFDTFVNSDAMIHDCLSFSAEYMYTGHPCCFCKKREGYTNVNELFLKSVDHHYPAYEENEIIEFIENVVLNSNDPMKEVREAFFNNDLKGLYPNATDAILKYLKNEIVNA